MPPQPWLLCLSNWACQHKPCYPSTRKGRDRKSRSSGSSSQNWACFWRLNLVTTISHSLLLDCQDTSSHCLMFPWLWGIASPQVWSWRNQDCELKLVIQMHNKSFFPLMVYDRDFVTVAKVLGKHQPFCFLTRKDTGFLLFGGCHLHQTAKPPAPLILDFTASRMTRHTFSFFINYPPSGSLSEQCKTKKTRKLMNTNEFGTIDYRHWSHKYDNTAEKWNDNTVETPAKF